MQFNNRVYDVIKWVTTIVLPAFGTLYFSLADIWHLPYGQEVVGTVMAIVTFLGVVLKISNSSYKKNPDGTIFVDSSDPSADKYKAEFNVPPEEMMKKDSVRFNISR